MNDHYPEFSDGVRIHRSADGERMLREVRELVPELRARAGEIEAGQRLPQDLVERIGEIGVWRMVAPKEVGGGTVDYPTWFRIMEELARGDGTAGWSLLVHIAACTSANQLSMEGAQRLFASPATVVAGTPIPGGTALKVDGGYQLLNVEGRFASNSGHASYFVAGFFVVDEADEEMPTMAPGAGDFSGIDPAEMMRRMGAMKGAYIPREIVTVVEGSWDTIGLRGTHSGKFVVTDGFVPEELTFSMMGPSTLTPSVDRGILGVGGHSMVGLGIARHALEEFYEIAPSKRPLIFGDTSTIDRRPVVQDRIAQAEAKLRAARAWSYELLEDALALHDRGEGASEGMRLANDICNTFCGEVAKSVVDTVFVVAGTAGVYRSSPIEQCYRDVLVVTAHMGVQYHNYERIGAVLTGAEEPSGPGFRPRGGAGAPGGPPPGFGPPPG